MRYSQELRDHILKRVLPPQSDSIERVAREEGISEQTIRNWKAQAISENYAPSGNDEPEKWSSQDKFLIVLETSGMSETDLAEYARQKGLYVEQIAEWRDACINANGGMARMARSLNAALKESEKEKRRLEKELQHKEKALAEAAALLVLRKKLEAIWGESEED